MKISTRFFIAAVTAAMLTPAYAEFTEVMPPPSNTGQVMPPAVSAPVTASSAPVIVGAPVTASPAPIAMGAPVPPAAPYDTHPHHKKGGIRVSLNINENSIPSINISQGRHHGRHRQPYWIPMHAGEPVPGNAVISVSGDHSGGTVYVCRAQYHGGMHAGKLMYGNCNVALGRHEVALHHYDVLVS